MMRFIATTIVTLCVVFSSFGQADDEILLLSGKTIQGKVTSEDSTYLYYDFYKKSGKSKARKFELERVFSITNTEGERLIYEEDSTKGNTLSVQEVGDYIQGEQDAMEYYRGDWTLLAGVPVTTGLGYVLTPSVFTFAIPFAYLVATGVPKYKIPNPDMAENEAYLLGFERVARNKRLFKSLAAGLIGTTLGFVAKESGVLE